MKMIHATNWGVQTPQSTEMAQVIYCFPLNSDSQVLSFALQINYRQKREKDLGAWPTLGYSVVKYSVQYRRETSL